MRHTKPIIFIYLVFSIFSNPGVALTMEETEIQRTDVINQEVVATLLNRWEAEDNLLEKAFIAKEIQGELGVSVDGIIGRETLKAIKASGVNIEFTKPSRAQNVMTKLTLKVARGELSQEDADNIIARRGAVSQVTQGFNSMDSDNDGILSESELEAGRTAAITVANTMLNQTDLAGELTKNEIIQNIYTGFSELDRDSDGVVTSDELNIVKRNVVSVVKEIFPKTEVDEKARRAEMRSERLASAVLAGTLSQAQADNIQKSRDTIKDIKAQVKDGDLTKEEARAEIQAIKDTLPEMPNGVGQGKKKKEKRKKKAKK